MRWVSTALVAASLVPTKIPAIVVRTAMSGPKISRGITDRT